MLLKANNINKSFGATQALKDVSIGLQAGQVHALVGENGAGKSTLFKICAGFLQGDGGTMTLNDSPFAPRNMHEAQQLGVALVFQEMTINPSLDIAENIFIDRMYEYSGFLGLTNWRRLRAAAQQVLDEIGSGLSVNQSLTELDLGQLKILEIARALSYKPKVLLLDESTAFLSTQEMEALFNVITNLREQGIAVGYISHHLEEIERIADVITILRDGQWVGDYQRGELTNEQIEAKMVGREIGQQIYPEKRNIGIDNEVVLSMDGITLNSRLQNINLKLHRGEVLGIGGLKGAGSETLVNIINGSLRPEAGKMTLKGQPYYPRHPFHAWEKGVAYLPGDRTGEGLIVDFSVQENLSMASIPHRGPFLDRGGERNLVNELMPKLQIKAASPDVACRSLSGGNLQKVVLGKCMAPGPEILLLNNPTRGIDVGARMQIYSIIRQLSEDGVAIILLSEDLLELIGMCDRIVVMRKGIISGEFSNSNQQNLTEEEIITHMI